VNRNNEYNYPIGIIVNRVCLTTAYIVGIEQREKMLEVGDRVEIRRTNQNGTMQVRNLNSDGTGLLGWIGSSYNNSSKFIERQS
jgi:hypothetical protein